MIANVRFHPAIQTGWLIKISFKYDSLERVLHSWVARSPTVCHTLDCERSQPGFVLFWAEEQFPWLPYGCGDALVGLATRFHD